MDITGSDITCNITPSNIHQSSKGLTIEDLEQFEKVEESRHGTGSRREVFKTCLVCGRMDSYPSIRPVYVCTREYNYILKLIEYSRPIIKHYQDDFDRFEEDLDSWCREWLEDLEGGRSVGEEDEDESESEVSDGGT